MAKKINSWKSLNINKKNIYLKNEYEDKSFYSWTIAKSKKFAVTLMMIILLSIFLICLYPIWPLVVKIAILYLSVGMLYLMVNKYFFGK